MGTAALERTRWGRRIPSFAVSDWLGRFEADGFDGTELWEFHFLSAEEAEQDRLAAASSSVKVYNSYVGFADTDAEARSSAAAAIRRLQPVAIKYNLGGDASKLDEYRRNLLAWAEELPSTCQLLCECHQGSVLETVDAASAFFETFDSGRFGIIVHASSGAAGSVGCWFDAFGPRVRHLHVQLRDEASDPQRPENRARLDGAFAAIREQGFAGSVAIEFTRGIGRDEDIEEIYRNACVDLAYVRDALGG